MQVTAKTHVRRPKSRLLDLEISSESGTGSCVSLTVKDISGKQLSPACLADQHVADTSCLPASLGIRTVDARTGDRRKRSPNENSRFWFRLFN